MAKSNKTKVKVNVETNDKTLAIVGLILNVLVLPGLGTIVWGDTKKGVTQLVLFIIGIPLSLILIGIPLLIGVWIWALISSIDKVKQY